MRSEVSLGTGYRNTMWSVGRDARQREDDLFHFLIDLSEHVYLQIDQSLCRDRLCQDDHVVRRRDNAIEVLW